MAANISLGDTGKQFLARFNSPRQTEEANSDGWGGMGGYMKAKKSKLNQQYRESYTRKSDIFNGVSIWVTGYTNPSSDELKRMLVEHGGQYQDFFSKTHVTHVIATNLPDSKIKALKKNDKVVRPEWIVDSIKFNKLSPINKYLLYSVNKRDGTALKFNSLKTTMNEKQAVIPSAICKDLGNVSVMTISSSAESMNDGGGDIEMFTDNNGAAETIGAPVLSKHAYSPTTVANASITKPAKAGDDNFISEFYSHSRLHHLAMWKAELKKFAVSIQQKNKGQQNCLVRNNKDLRLIMHVDLDSFFVSVFLKLNPDLKGKPVAVCHSGRSQKEGKTYENSWSEIASCSYEARSFGLRNGMMLRAAKQLCPSLICVPYQFEEYRNVSQTFYEILSTYTTQIEAVSCDEALLDITSLISMEEDVTKLAEKIRKNVRNKTGCTASCGIGNSILIARLATKRAKPDGVCFITPKEISQFIEHQNANDLPGVGRAHGKKFQAHNIVMCKDLQQWTLPRLRKEFGQKHGEMLYNFCRGKDERLLRLDQERKSVSAEINYGMRFTKMEDVEKFVRELSEEVKKRLKEINKKGCQITLKLMTKQTDSEPVKFLGHGLCDNLSRSVTLPSPTDDRNVIAKSVLSMLRTLQVQPSDIRGMGIQVTKLFDATAEGSTKSLLQFTQVLTPQELHKRDDMMHNTALKSSTHQKQLSSNSANQDKLLSKTSNQDQPSSKLFNPEGRLQPITSFLGPCPTFNKFDELPTKQLPPLPNVSIEDDFVPGPSKAPPTCYETQNQFAFWDPDVFKELPENIQLELSEMKAQQQLTRLKIPKVGASPSEKHKVSGKGQARSILSKNAVTLAKRGRGRGRAKKLDQHYSSPVKNAIVNSKKQQDLFHGSSNNQSVDAMTTGDKLNSTDNIHCSGFISPTQVNFDVLSELPEEIRNEVLTEFKKSKHYLREKAKKSIKTSFDSKKNENPRDSRKLLSVNKQQTTNETSVAASSTIMSSELDQSFLRALPEDLRNEIIEEAKTTKRRRTDDQNSVRMNSFASDRTTSKEQKDIRLSPITNNLGNEAPSEFNQSVLDALPDDIREEILKNRPTPNTDRQSHSKSQCIVISDDVVSEDNHSILPEVKKLTQVLPELRGVSGCRDVRTLIRCWIEEFSEEPLVEDIEEICDYFHRLLLSYNLETLMVLLKFIRRIIADIPTWHEPFNRMLKYVQQEMQKAYNGSLPVKWLP